VEARIGAVGRVLDLPLGDAELLGEEVWQAYLSAIAALPGPGVRDVRVAYTPMHGVGLETLLAAFERAGFAAPAVVAEQAEPDPDFPTVAFPNPEEPGATDALLALADEVGADLAIALDPDADRCALAVGGRMLSGDETGVLLGDHLLRSGGYAGIDGGPLVATTVVSSSMLRSVAASHGARYAETLTGFKWIVRGGPGLVFGYEEALGYCVDPDAVRDKDGIAAAVVACDLAATLKASGRTLRDRLDELARAHGVHLTAGLSLRMEPVVRDAAVERLRSAPPAGWDVAFPAPDVLVLRRAGERLVVRPSGTEPKLKAYLEVVQPVDGDLVAARAAAEERLATLRDGAGALLGG
jgi:phosphomannomutase